MTRSCKEHSESGQLLQPLQRAAKPSSSTSTPSHHLLLLRDDKQTRKSHFSNKSSFDLLVATFYLSSATDRRASWSEHLAFQDIPLATGRCKWSASTVGGLSTIGVGPKCRASSCFTWDAPHFWWSLLCERPQLFVPGVGSKLKLKFAISGLVCPDRLSGRAIGLVSEGLETDFEESR